MRARSARRVAKSNAGNVQVARSRPTATPNPFALDDDGRIRNRHRAPIAGAVRRGRPQHATHHPRRAVTAFCLDFGFANQRVVAQAFARTGAVDGTVSHRLSQTKEAV